MKNIIKSIAVFGVSNLLSKILSSFIIPLLIAKYISKENFAASDIIISFFSLIALLSSFSLESALARFFYNKEKNADLVSTVIITSGIASFCLTIISLFLSKKISILLFDNITFSKQCILGSLLIFFSNISAIVNLYLRFSEKIKMFAIISISQFIVVLTYIIFSFKFNIISINTILIAILLQGIIPIIFITPFLIRNFKFRISVITLNMCLKYSLPLVPITIMVWINVYLNRFILQHSNGLQSLSDYMLALKFASIITLIETVFNMFWQPYFFKRFSDKDNFPKFIFIFNLLIILFSFFYLFCIFLFPLITNYFYDLKYLKSNYYFGILALTFIINIFNSLISIGINAKNKTGTSSLIFISTSIIGVCISYILLYFFNTIGLVLSSLLLSIINISITIIITNKFIKINYDYKKLILSFLISFIYCILFSYLNVSLGVKFLFLLTSIILVTIINLSSFTSNSLILSQIQKLKVLKKWN